MLKQCDKVLSYIVIGLGILFIALTPMYASFPSRGGIEYIGAVLFLPFLGLLNLARVKSQHQSTKILAIIANVIALIYLLSAYFIVKDPAAIAVSVPVLGLCFTSWRNPKNEKPSTSTRA